MPVAIPCVRDGRARTFDDPLHEWTPFPVALWHGWRLRVELDAGVVFGREYVADDAAFDEFLFRNLAQVLRVDDPLVECIGHLLAHLLDLHRFPAGKVVDLKG